MAAPEYVPVKPMDDVRTYESPPRRPGSWLATRPGDLHGENPHGDRFGHPGPDQGYALLLAKRLADRLHLEPGEHVDDVIAGCVGVALKRASLLGRAPVIYDLTAAYTVWGFLDEKAPAELVELRKKAFDEVALPLHYTERHRIVAAVRDEVLRTLHTAIADEHAANWQALLDVAVLEHASK
ncbi:MAG: hypothetical protein QOH79_2177 [Acidimicrobiaceae bacterium]|jgi:hypothetical protein